MNKIFCFTLKIPPIFTKIVLSITIAVCGLGLINERSWLFFIIGILFLIGAILIWTPIIIRTIKEFRK